MKELPAWIQAGAAVAQVVLAVALFIVTSKYVRLTRELSATASRELELARQNSGYARRADLVDLQFLAARLREQLKEFPRGSSQTSWGGRLRSSSLWSEDDLQHLRQLAAKAGPSFARAAANAVIALTWIRDQALVVRAEPASQGYALTTYRWQEHESHYSAAMNDLQTLTESAETVLSTVDA